MPFSVGDHGYMTIDDGDMLRPVRVAGGVFTNGSGEHGLCLMVETDNGDRHFYNVSNLDLLRDVRQVARALLLLIDSHFPNVSGDVQ